MSSAHKTTLQKANEAVSRGDHEGFLAFCTENTSWTFVGERTLVGKAADVLHEASQTAGAQRVRPRPGEVLALQEERADGVQGDGAARHAPRDYHRARSLGRIQRGCR